jgi:catechol 2,3-dioxygenase-like lactoylglutathione lyase family enzyme
MRFTGRRARQDKDGRKRLEQSMIKPKRLGHATFDTPDLDKQIDYYTNVVGLVLAERDKNRAFLATKIGQLVVQLDKGTTQRATALSFEVAPDADFDAMAKELAKDGIKSEIRNDAVPGTPATLSFTDIKGTRIELFKEWKFFCKHAQVLGVGPLKLGHFAFEVEDPQAITEFYSRVMGFKVSDWIEDFFVFMRCGVDHHTCNFIKGVNGRMHHMAFELKDMAHMQDSCELFGQRNIPIVWGPLRHGPGHNVATYHRNPDDQVIEFFFELDTMKDEELGYFEPRPWHRDQPQRPKVWSRRFENGGTTIWGPPPTPEFHRNRE